ncbi:MULTISPECIES: COG4223 family protein [Alphaproteobacteria]|uniref:Membrane protein n=2 Tax=Alphaproteobacteria TaxID=28211 RepID=A0A512HJU7_9HYPH|nr:MULTISPECIES: mitofilin family membrane protein [Alphaproteobacteria]GEO85727.1 membrane protein [Ciceribacter naphthalenivorans]GLR21913.1 membrane protein [Ciceribacter naphthalenivorans]GLT04769.1 membrane protein [Sphingomonas psychrolutea]
MVSGKPPRRSKSPKDPVIIDLTAEATDSEATAQPQSNGSEAPESEPTSSTVETPVDQPSEVTGEPMPAVSEEIVDAEAPTSEPEAGTEPPPKTVEQPAPRAANSSAKAGPALPVLIAAGIFGGLIALAAAGSMQYAGYLPAAAPEATTPADTSGLSVEIETLKAQLAGIATAPAPTADPRLEERLTALEEAMANPASPATDTTALDELRQRLAQNDETLAALKDEIANNATALGETETRLTERLAAAEKKLDEPRTDVEMAKAIALTALKSATERGGPFMAELDALASIAPDDPAIEGLRPYAATGVASRAELVRKFGNVADKVLAAIHQPDPNEGIGQRLLSSAFSVIKVRPVGNVEGASPEAILARMQDKLQNGDLKGAALEWESLPEAGKAVSTDYVSTLMTRIEIETLVGDALAAVISGKQG